MAMSDGEEPKERREIDREKLGVEIQGGMIQQARRALRPKKDGKSFATTRRPLWQWILIFGGIYGLVRLILFVVNSGG